MYLARSVRRLFQVSLFAITMSFGTVSSAQAIITFTLNWTGDSGSSLTGTFTGTDDNSDGFIKGGNLNSTANEVTAFDVTFRDSLNNILATYTLDDPDPNLRLIDSIPDFNFYYQLSPTPVGVLQSGNALSTTGFSIGSDSGYLLDTTEGAIDFTDNVTFNNDGGGTLTASPVPWETDVLPLIGATIFFGGGMWIKRRRATQK